MEPVWPPTCAFSQMLQQPGESYHLQVLQIETFFQTDTIDYYQTHLTQLNEQIKEEQRVNHPYLKVGQFL
jgi:hypothetical protein